MELPIAAAALPANHILIRFGSGIPSYLQGQMMLAAERFLREHQVAAEVYKDVAPDDSKLRRNMTKEQRDKL